MTIPGVEEATLWQTTYNDFIDTQYVTITADTVRISPHPDAYWGIRKYVFPLQVGKGWNGDFISDTTSVVEKRKLHIEAGRFLCAFRLEETWGALNDYGAISTWYSAGTGILYKHERSWGFGFQNRTWELLSFKIIY
jgi:hypothetical protein